MIACIATNDLYVQSAWGRVMKVDDKIKMISDSEMVWLNKVGLVDDRRSFLCPYYWTERHPDHAYGY
jgi:peroxiredoxin